MRKAKYVLPVLALLAAGAIAGVILTGSTDNTPRIEAQREASPRAPSITLPSFAEIAASATPSIGRLLARYPPSGPVSRTPFQTVHADFPHTA